MSNFFEEAIEVLEILVEALCPRPTFDKLSIYKSPRKYSMAGTRPYIQSVYHRKTLQRS